ncbi:MAG TPA: hypothetical protein VN911_15950 [Candidatus Acidoferrum sp.]|nr:hypothetical protein [Candidatus Acidoferrum sp.]
MLYLRISRSWLFSQTAQRIYFTSSLLVFAFIGTLIGVRMALAASGARSLAGPASSVVRMLLYPEVTGVAVLWIGMWYFWFGFDTSHYLKKAVWFVLLGFLAPFGTVLYYFFVYRHLVEAQSQDA